MSLSKDFLPIDKAEGLSSDFKHEFVNNTLGVPEHIQSIIGPHKLDELTSLIPVPNEKAIVPQEDLTTGQRIARLAVKAPWPNLLAEEGLNQAGGGNSDIAQTLRQANNTLPLNFGDEFKGVLETGADALTGNIPRSANGYFQDLLDQYRYHRDFQRKQAELGAQRSPFSDFMGSVVGSLPAFFLPMSSPAKVASWGANALKDMPLASEITTKLPGLVSHLLNTGEMSTLGGLIGAGMSDSDIIKNPMSVINDGLHTALQLGVLYQAAPALNWLKNISSPKALSLQGGVKAISGGGDAAKGLKVVSADPRILPPEADGLELMRKEGKVLLQNNIITNLDNKSLGMANFLRNPGEQSSEFLRRNLSKTPQSNLLDFGKLMDDNQAMISNRAKEADDILSKSFKGKKAIPPAMVFGNNASGRTNRLIQNLENLHQDIVQGEGLAPGEGDAFRTMRKVLTSPSLTKDDLVELKRQLGQVIGPRAFTNGAPPGSTMSQLLDDYNNIKDFLQNGANSLGAVAGKRYALLEREQSQLLALKGHILHGNTAAQEAANAASNFASPSLGMGDIAGGNSGGGFVPWLMGAIGKNSAKAINMGATVGGALLKPGLADWLPSLFPSYDAARKKLKTASDIELYNHYVDRMPNIDNNTRMKLKMKANTEGSIDTAVIPDYIRKQAIANMGYEGEA